jgi:dynein heavy chain 1
MPWDLIRYLIVETYGGKIDDESDFNELRKLVESFLTPDAYEEDYKLVGAKDTEQESSLTVPGGTGMKAFGEWVENLPEREPPTYLGLPANAEKLLLVGQGKDMISNLARVRDVLEEGEQLIAEADAP